MRVVFIPSGFGVAMRNRPLSRGNISSFSKPPAVPNVLQQKGIGTA